MTTSGNPEAPASASDAGFDGSSVSPRASAAAATRPASAAAYAKLYAQKFDWFLVPIEPGRKFPTSHAWGKTAINDAAKAEKFYAAHPSWNMGLALGPSRMCSLDIDDIDSFRLVCAAFGISLDDLVASTPTIQGRDTGMRLMFRMPDEDLRYRKLNWPSRADPDGRKYRDLQRMAREESKAGNQEAAEEFRAQAKGYAIYTVCEFRCSVEGKQLQDVLPPSVHPDTKLPYRWITQPAKTLESWPFPPDWLLTFWREWERFEPQLRAACPWAVYRTIYRSAPPKVPKSSAGGSVIEAFNAAHDIEASLLEYGYKRIGTRFLPPTSSTKLPGVVPFPGENKVWIHNASDALCSDATGRPVAPFDLFCANDHAGDLGKAVKAAAKLLGMDGTPAKRTSKTPQRAHSGPIDPETGEILPAPRSPASGADLQPAAPSERHVGAPAVDAPPDSLPDDDAEAVENTELALSELFSAAAAGKFRWTPGLEWLANAGTHWQRDGMLQRYSLAKRICRQQAQFAPAKTAAAISKSSTVGAMINLARSDPRLATPAEAWNAEPMLLNTPGGVIDLATGAPTARTGLFTQVSRVAPSNGVPARWLQFLAQIFENKVEVIEFIQRMCGYCFTGSAVEQKLFFLYGAGANGKSVFLDTLQAIAGDYGHTLPSEALMSSRGEKHPTIYAGLFGKRLAVSSEIEEAAYWAESKLKELTGNERLQARFMRQDFFDFRITHKHVIAGNFKPRLKGDDFAMARRMVLVPFARTFSGAERDPNLLGKLRPEHPAILGWIIEGASKWHKNGLMIPESISGASREYMAENNDLMLWREECCLVHSDASDRAMTLYRSFADWKQRIGENAGSAKAFSQRLERLHNKRKTGAGMVFEGISVAEQQSGQEGQRWYQRQA